MKTINDYLNEPALANEPMALREVHAIRLMIHDETKDMTIEEKRAYHNNNRKEMDAYFARLGVTPKYADFSGQGKLKLPQA
ncbi:MAG: hypothetical protein LBK25_03700 [Treponema sp.]|jgi:hypothetical protein|nr:hypothetical protein [Treponema sp.]